MSKPIIHVCQSSYNHRLHRPINPSGIYPRPQWKKITFKRQRIFKRSIFLPPDDHQTHCRNLSKSRSKPLRANHHDSPTRKSTLPKHFHFTRLPYVQPWWYANDLAVHKDLHRKYRPRIAKADRCWLGLRGDAEIQVPRYFLNKPQLFVRKQQNMLKMGWNPTPISMKSNNNSGLKKTWNFNPQQWLSMSWTQIHRGMENENHIIVYIAQTLDQSG